MNQFQLIANIVLGTIGALYVLTGLNRLHLGTRLRGLIRRMLGINYAETLIAQWTSDVQQCEQQVDNLTGSQGDLRRQVSGQATRHASLRHEVEELGILLRQYTDVLGPVWKTAAGTRMPLALLSTGHLKNIVEGQYGSHEHRAFIERELQRRATDASWREDDANDKRLASMIGKVPAHEQANWDGKMRGTLGITDQTRSRVANALPLWAREIIFSFEQPQGPPIKRAERARIKRVLPVWAQDLIRDLERRRAKS